jgi:hypothetical protein
VTFFGDDILISGDKSYSGLQDHLVQIITSSRLKLHPTKTVPMVGPGENHSALGMILNSSGTSLNVPRSYRRKLRALIRLCQREGPQALASRGVTTKEPKAYLTGKIAFATYVNPENESLTEELAKIAW